MLKNACFIGLPKIFFLPSRICRMIFHRTKQIVAQIAVEIFFDTTEAFTFSGIAETFMIYLKIHIHVIYASLLQLYILQRFIKYIECIS